MGTGQAGTGCMSHSLCGRLQGQLECRQQCHWQPRYHYHYHSSAASSPSPGRYTLKGWPQAAGCRLGTVPREHTPPQL
jgi:hypothetical protein